MPICTGCGEEKPTDLFTTAPRYRQGWCQPCKACQSRRVNEYRLKNKEARAEYQRDYHKGIRRGRKGRPKNS